jgi:hypothetical protein
VSESREGSPALIADDAGSRSDDGRDVQGNKIEAWTWIERQILAMLPFTTWIDPPEPGRLIALTMSSVPRLVVVQIGVAIEGVAIGDRCQGSRY